MTSNTLPLVSVIILCENAKPDQIKAAIKNVKEQTYKNIDLIISTFYDPGELRDECKSYSLNLRWFISDPSKNFVNELLEVADGEYIFYKTINNILWYRRHIHVHLEQYALDAKCKWSLSHVEYRNLEIPDHPLNVIGYRIVNPPKIEEVTIDEMSHHKSAKVDWGACVTSAKDTNETKFYAGLATQQWLKQSLRGTMPPEISVVEWVYPKNRQAPINIEELYKQVGVPKAVEVKEDPSVDGEGNISIRRTLPTIMGNKFIDEYNNKIREILRSTDSDSVESIGIKRTVGMGDVILVEPVIKALRYKYKKAKITLYTAKPDIVKYFLSEPDEVVKVEEQVLVQDFLADTDNQVKFDLDLAYESRFNQEFVASYFEVCGLNYEDYNYTPQLTISADNTSIEILKKVGSKNYVVVCGDGSGWPGKTWGVNNYREVIKYLQSEGYTVVEPGFETSDLTDRQFNKCSLDDMVILIAFSNFCIVGDNGPMHVARAFDKPCITIAGAALPYYTNPNRNNIFYVQNNLSPDLGIKHRQFFNIAGDAVTFVPVAEKDKTCGLKDIVPEAVIDCIKKFLAKPKSILSGVDCEFGFNIPGYVYYHDVDCNMFQKEDINDHPDQDKDLSLDYASRWEELYKKYAVPWAKRVKEHRRGKWEGYTLDIGCNIGLTVKACAAEDFIAYGIDMNRSAIEKGKELFPEIADHLLCDDFMKATYEVKFDVITCDQVLEHISDPVAFIEKCKSLLVEGGVLFIGTPDMGSKAAQRLVQKWPQVGTGEHVILYTQQAFNYLMRKVGLQYKLLEDSFTSGGITAVCSVENELEQDEIRV